MLEAKMIKARIVNDFLDINAIDLDNSIKNKDKIELIKKIYSQAFGEAFVVTLETDYGVGTFDMKKEVLTYYKTERITERLKQTFIDDCETGKIKFWMSKNLIKYKMQ